VTWYRALPGPFSPVPLDREDRSGLPAGSSRDERAPIIAALLIGLAFGLFILYYILQYPVPSGGDPGEWTAGSYQFAGLPYPSWYASSDSPPLLGVFLGYLILVGHGPIVGAQLFLVAESILLCGSTYLVARSLTHYPITALAVAVFILANPSAESLMFSGAYQFLFSWIFLNLAIAYAIRFVRSKSDWHLAAFWLSASAAVLSHPSMLVEVPAFFVFLAVILLWMRVLPKQIITSRVSWAGMAVFAVSLGGWYYLVPKYGYHQNNFVPTGPYFSQIDTSLGTIWEKIYTPFYPSYLMDSPTAFLLLVGASIVIPLVLILVRLTKPGWMTLSWVAVGVWALSITATAAVGWWHEVITPYFRFGDLLAFPIFIGGALAIEGAFRWAAAPSATPIPAAPARPPLRRLVWRRFRHSPHARRWAQAIVVVVALISLGAYFDLVSLPAAQRYVVANTNNAHNESMLQAVGAISNSNISGSILTTSRVTSWARSLTERDVYAPFLPSYALNAPHIFIDEEIGLSLAARYTVTNDFVDATVTGNSSEYITGVPTYGISYFGLFVPVIRLVPQSLNVTLASGSVVTFFGGTLPAPTVVIPPTNTSRTLTMVFDHSGVELTVTATAVPGTDTVAIAVVADSSGSPIASIGGRLQSVSGQGNNVSEPAPGQFNWSSPSVPGGFGVTNGEVFPAAALRAVGHLSNNLSRPATVTIQENSSNANGTPSLGFSVNLTSPLAQNFITNLPTFFVATTIWSQLSARFFLNEPSSEPPQFANALVPNEIGYLEAEYNAVVFFDNGDWSVLLLSANW